MTSIHASGSAIIELQRALEEYLSILIGLPKKEHGLARLIGFKWKILLNGRQVRALQSLQLYSCHYNNLTESNCDEQVISVANIWFEVLSVVHLMAMLTLSDADSMMIPKDLSDCERDVVGLLLKASGHLEFCITNVLIHIPLQIQCDSA